MRDYRIIPTLLLKNGQIVKGEQFKNHQYIGSPINTVCIFNELKADELFILDIDASINQKEPDYELLSTIGVRSFMPLAYGGGITSVDQARRVLSLGFEKVVINNSALNTPSLIDEMAKRFGSQAIVVSIDYINQGNTNIVTSHLNQEKLDVDLLEWAKECQSRGAGELLMTCVSREGTYQGFDSETIERIGKELTIPLICQGGANSLQSIHEVVQQNKASAVAVGSMFVYSKHKEGILISYPEEKSRVFHAFKNN